MRILVLFFMLAGSMWAQVPKDLIVPAFANMCVGGATTKLLRYSINYAPGGAKFQVIRNDRSTSIRPWNKNTSLLDAGFAITCVTVREGGEEVYLCGILDTGLDVIERWTFPPANGSYSFTSNSPSAPIGRSLPAYSYTQSVKGGGSYVNNPIPTPRIQRLWTGLGGKIRVCEVDPEGRFLLIITHDYDYMYRVDLTVETIRLGAPIYTKGELPQMHLIRSMNVTRHNTEGRKYILTTYKGSIGTARVCLMSDGDNNGVFNSITFYNVAQFEATEYDNDVWTNVYAEANFWQQ